MTGLSAATPTRYHPGIPATTTTRVHRGARIPLRALVAVALVLLTVLGLAGPRAWAATPTPAEEGTWISFAGSAVRTNFDDDGVPSAGDPVDVIITIDCAADDECTISGWPWNSADLVTPYTGPTGSWSAPLVGSWCDTSYQRPLTITLASVTPTQLVATEELPGSGWNECADGAIYTFGVLFEMTLAYVDGDPCVIEARVCPPEAVSEPVAEAATGDDAEENAIGELWSPRDPAAPTIFSTLATPDETLSPVQCALAAALAVILALLMGFPTKLLSSVSDTLGGRLGAWWRRIRPSRGEHDAEADAPIRTATRFHGWAPASLGVLAAALISSFVDPAFGFDAASARAFASLAIGFAVDVVLGWFVLIWVVGRLHPHATAAFEFRPLTLVLVAATVVFTRVTGVQPGIVFGLVAGVVFGTAVATASAKARLTLITAGWAFGIGLLAWVGYSLLQTAGDELGILFVRETLAALTAAGIASLPLALLPVEGFAGRTVFVWNRWVWGGAYAVGLLAFFLVLMPMPTSWAEVQVSLVAWIAMYAVYSVVALGLWLAVTRPWRTDDQDQAVRRPPTAETASTTRSTTSDT